MNEPTATQRAAGIGVTDRSGPPQERGTTLRANPSGPDHHNLHIAALAAGIPALCTALAAALQLCGLVTR